KTDCNKCHTFENWKPEKFDHNKTRFSLEGAHSKLKCFQCHPSELKNGNIFTKFKLDDFKCASCHSQRL
ncbi:MAG: cytochrome C, partial [Ignavibacterium sp.]